MSRSIKSTDIINISNIFTIIVSFFVYRCFMILLSTILFLAVNAVLVFEISKKREISFFRYIWSFIVTSMGYATGITIVSNMNQLWILYICISLIYVYIITKNKNKSIITILFYTLCLSAVLISMTMGINQSFDTSDGVYITATVVHKQKNGDWFGTNTFSQLDIYSSEKFEGTDFGYQVIGMAGDYYNEYDIGDEITIIAHRGLFKIKYFSTYELPM